MSATYILKKPTTAECFDTSMIKYCLPKRMRCIKPHNELIVPCDEVYNCNKNECNLEFYMPFVKGDCIMFQVKMFDYFSADMTDPDDIFGTSVILNFIDGNNTSFGDQNSPFVGYFSGWNGVESFQNIKIDTTTFPDCWKLEIKNFDQNGDLKNEVCTQEYKLCRCEGTFEIENKQDCGFDASRNYYGESKGQYGGALEFDRFSNKIRLKGALKPCNTIPVVIKDSDFITGIELRNTVDLNINPYVPKFLNSYLANVILSTGDVYIDDVRHTIKEVNSQLISRTNVFRYIATFEEVVKNKISCNKC